MRQTAVQLGQARGQFDVPEWRLAWKAQTHNVSTQEFSQIATLHHAGSPKFTIDGYSSSTAYSHSRSAAADAQFLEAHSAANTTIAGIPSLCSEAHVGEASLCYKKVLLSSDNSIRQRVLWHPSIAANLCKKDTATRDIIDDSLAIRTQLPACPTLTNLLSARNHPRRTIGWHCPIRDIVVTEPDGQLLADLRRASAMAIPRCIVSRYATGQRALKRAISAPLVLGRPMPISCRNSQGFRKKRGILTAFTALGSSRNS